MPKVAAFLLLLLASRFASVQSQCSNSDGVNCPTPTVPTPTSTSTVDQTITSVPSQSGVPVMISAVADPAGGGQTTSSAPTPAQSGVPTAISAESPDDGGSSNGVYSIDGGYSASDGGEGGGGGTTTSFAPTQPGAPASVAASPTSTLHAPSSTASSAIKVGISTGVTSTGTKAGTTSSALKAGATVVSGGTTSIVGVPSAGERNGAWNGAVIGIVVGFGFGWMIW